MNLRHAWNNIVVMPADVLTASAQNVLLFDDELLALEAKLKETCQALSGAGLAAPQIGVDAAVFVARWDDDMELQTMVNPTIIASRGSLVTAEEGCFSLPGIVVSVSRPSKVIFQYQDTQGVSHTVEAVDYQARVLQHETDHLFGRLTVDYLSADERAYLLKHVAKPTV